MSEITACIGSMFLITWL